MNKTISINNRDLAAQNRLVRPGSKQETASWKYWLTAALSLVLLAGAIVSTSSVARLSYQSAQLQQQQKELRAQKQLLAEQYAAVSSLTATTAFAQDNGFLASTEVQATLDVALPLAQAQ